MTRRNKVIVGAIGVLALAAALIPFAIGPATLYWHKRKAHAIMAKYPPEDRANLDIVPTKIVLPPALSGPLSSDVLNSATLHFPPPDAKTFKGSALVLTYPLFTVVFTPPTSITFFDAVSKAAYHKSAFEHLVDVHHARAADIDGCPDLPALKQLLLLLSEKGPHFAATTTYELFDQNDRQGLIRAEDKDRKFVIAEVTFPKSGLAMGVWFKNEEGVNMSELHSFLATLQVEAAPTPTSSPAATAPARTGE